MKKLELKGKLSLNKETITKLNNSESNSVKGGAGTKTGPSRCDNCNTTKNTFLSGCC